ncbi:glycosyltransferase family protein [Hamadaea sp. NPDC051192]|uniref:glycosyltransferase family protein n=1 Tax=Hamadaea sp. NPDC051192 TaxID=3154940 RepID=UPI0034488498
MSAGRISVVGIIQARMGSTRLPSKVLKTLAGRTVLGRVVRAAHESGALDEVVVATTVEDIDDEIVAECERLGVAAYRGPVDDVLSRFIGALDEHPADAVMRFSADNPLIDPEIVALACRVFRSVPGLDYLSTSIKRMLPLGMDVEIIDAATLRQISDIAEGFHRIHVTSYAYSNPDQFRVMGLTLPPDRSNLRLTVDTEDDWRLVEEAVAHFGDTSVSLQKMVEWLAANPEIAQINSHVEQKTLNQG